MTRAVAGVAGVALGAGAVAVALRRALLVVRVHGGSMRPTFVDGDVLLAHRLPVLPRGGVAVFRAPHHNEFHGSPPYRVKRLVALPGDPTPDWVHGTASGAPVPRGMVVVRGDHHRSEDSRQYGYVPRSDVLAIVIGRLSRGRNHCESRSP